MAIFKSKTSFFKYLNPVQIQPFKICRIHKSGFENLGSINFEGGGFEKKKKKKKTQKKIQKHWN